MKKLNIYNITAVILTVVLMVTCIKTSILDIRATALNSPKNDTVTVNDMSALDNLNVFDHMMFGSDRTGIEPKITGLTINDSLFKLKGTSSAIETTPSEELVVEEETIVEVSETISEPVEIIEEEPIIVEEVKEEAPTVVEEAPVTSTNSYRYSDDDIYLLARIVMAEVEGESQRCKELVAQVVLNRVEGRNEFPNTVYGVIFQRNQFTPTSNGRWERVQPNQACYDAVYTVLNAAEPITPALYFESCIGDSWHSRNLTMVAEEDGHRFYID